MNAATTLFETLYDEYLRRYGTITLRQLTRSFNQVRGELREVGLLEDGRYLDRIDCVLSPVPTLRGELGFVYDEGVGGLDRLLGYAPGVIYVALNSPVEAYVPGGTLLDTLRHEFAHAWAWLDPRFIRRPWFAETFGVGYFSEWDTPPRFDARDFVSHYATTKPREDFAETFMTFLRNRRSVGRFRRRPGLHRKLLAVASAVREAARERAPCVRGPRAR
jgi:hypothetical protein